MVDAEGSAGPGEERAAQRLAVQHAAGHARLLAGHAQYLITTAGRAPSVHNSQPWRFKVGAEQIELWSDPGRRTWSDASGREMIVSCGAALFGLRLAVRSLGYQPVVDLLPNPGRLRLLARVRIGEPVPMNALEGQMLAAVPHRHTHRGPFAAVPLPRGLLAGLQDDVRHEGAELALIWPGLAYERLAALVASAARRGDLDPRARATIRRWTRPAPRPDHNDDEESASRDGVPATALPAGQDGGPAAGQDGGQEGGPAAGPAGEYRRARLPQRDFDLGRHLGRLVPGGAAPGATAILLTRDDRRADWLRAGQALDRLLLHAASSWVFASLYSQPVEDSVTRTLIRTQLGLHGYPQIILQLGHATSAAATPRRPAQDILG